jgi:putative transcriptional regulator
MMEDEVLLKNRISEHRERLGLTQQALADAVGVRRETIVNLERGRYNPSLKLALKICAVLEATVEDVFLLE